MLNDLIIHSTLCLIGSGIYMVGRPLLYDSPSASTGIYLSAVRIGVGLRLGVPVLSPHPCPCDKVVSEQSHHDLSCQLSTI